MSKLFRDKFGTVQVDRNEIRNFTRRPGRTDDDGNIVYTTEQAHKDMCNVNNIIRKYDKTGLISHVSRIEAKFGDMTGIDFKTMADTVAQTTSLFQNLPSNIRNRFENDPGKLLAFMEDPANRDEAISLGLIKESWPENLDGIGEHVTQDLQDQRDSADNENQPAE